jgi:hypothetical protein
MRAQLGLRLISCLSTRALHRIVKHCLGGARQPWTQLTNGMFRRCNIDLDATWLDYVQECICGFGNRQPMWSGTVIGGISPANRVIPRDATSR